jgi:hypothetical protein
MQIDGACHCGRITFTAVVNPSKVNLCHCTDCQSLSGSPWRASIPSLAADFRLISGAPRIYIKTAESGARRQQAFCADCGSPIYSAAEHDTPLYNIRLGVIRQRDQLSPGKQIWTSSALPWASDITAVPGASRG